MPTSRLGETMMGLGSPDYVDRMQADAFAAPIGTWHEKVRRLYEYWLAIHPAAETLPGLQHYCADAIAELLPLVWILDVHRGPLRFQYRYVGAAHERAMQRPLQGSWMDEMHPAFLKSYIYQHYVDVANHGRPSYRKGRARFGVDPDLYQMERILLPLARNRWPVDAVLAVTVYYDDAGKEAHL